MERGPLVALGVAVAVVVATAAAVVVRSIPHVPELPPASSSHLEVHPTPNVIVAVRDLSRLEGASFHMERIVELSDEQSRLFGLLQTKDAILLVAVGEVTAGVDLAKVSDGDVVVDPVAKSVRLHLHAPEVFSAALDSKKTHVYSRTTDRLADRREDLEGLARADAESGIKQAAIEGGILERARVSVERTLRALLTSLGFADVRFDWI